MSGAFELLGLAHGADERQIKRAYASKLKTTRPDTDPHGFQALNEAYQAALQHSRLFSHDEEVDAETTWPTTDTASEWAPDDTGAIVVGHQPPALAEAEFAPPPPPQYFAFEPFFDELAHIAGSRSANELDGWLHNHVELYDLKLKTVVGSAIQDHLHENALLFLSDDHLRVITDFFGLDMRPWLLERRRALRAIEQENTARYGLRDPKLIRELKRPFSRPRALWMAMKPGFVDTAADLAWRLRMDLNGWPSSINHEQDHFFRQLAEPGYYGRWRHAVNGGRALILAAVIFLLLLLAPRASLWEMLRLTAGWAVGIFIAFSAWSTVSWLKVKAKQTFQQGNPLWQQVPVALGVLALLLFMIPGDGEALGGAVASFSLLFNWSRIFQMLRFWLGSSWVIGLLTKRFMFDMPVGKMVFALALIPILLAGFDALYARRHRMPLYAVAGNPWTQRASYAFLFGGLALSFILA